MSVEKILKNKTLDDIIRLCVEMEFIHLCNNRLYGIYEEGRKKNEKNK